MGGTSLRDPNQSVHADHCESVAKNTTLTVLTNGVLANDSDVDGDSLTAVSVRYRFINYQLGLSGRQASNCLTNRASYSPA